MKNIALFAVVNKLLSGDNQCQKTQEQKRHATNVFQFGGGLIHVALNAVVVILNLIMKLNVCAKSASKVGEIQTQRNQSQL
jgi:hypothetical protein